MLNAESVSSSGGNDNRVVRPALATLIIATFLFGGASRADVASLVVLRPISAMLFVVALFVAFRAAWKRQWQPVALAAAVMLLTALHLIPLPPSLWASLPGREVIADAFAAIGKSIPWLPLSMAPLATWNALFALLGPFAALLFALALPDRDQPMMLKIILAMGIFSGFVGLLQIIGPMNGPFYFYRITNYGTAVGLFANRNHQAIFLATLFPLLAAFAAMADGPKDRIRLQRVLAISTGAFLVPLLLVTGSRTGLLLGFVGLLSCFWIYRPAAVVRTGTPDAARRRRLFFLLAGGLALLVLMTLLAARASSFQRLVELDAAQDMRFRAFPVIWDLVLRYFPLGSGIGSFPEVYNIYEPRALLTSSYLNHAHNDLLETAMIGGFPAILLILVAALMAAAATWRLARARLAVDRPVLDARGRAILLGRAGMVGLLILAIGSVADYPLRAPSLAVILTIYVAFVVSGWQSGATAPRSWSGRSSK